MPDPLQSWRSGATKQHIVGFVQAVTSEGGPQYVEPAERVATCDLDGTLWTEQPIYPQARFVIDLLKKQGNVPGSGPIASLLQRISDGIADIHQSFTTIANLVRISISVDAYISSVQKWFETPEARHPCFERPYTDLTYQPMRELLGYLRANDFRTYIVSGSGIEFLRAFSEKVFEIPPEQVIGSSLQTEFTIMPDGKAELYLVPWPDFLDNGKRKAESINEFLGKRPIAAFGNSDGDQQMLEWTAAGSGARLMLLVHHTDEAREYSYGANAHIGRLDLALSEAMKHEWDSANNRGWIVVDMARDWDQVYSFGEVQRNGSSACRPR